MLPIHRFLSYNAFNHVYITVVEGNVAESAKDQSGGYDINRRGAQYT